MKLTKDMRPFALALCGGGITGGSYQVGCLTAWEEHFGEGSIQRDCRLFIGSSAGANIASMIATGTTARRMYDDIMSREDAFEIKRTDIVLFKADIVWETLRKFFALLFRLVIRKFTWQDFLYHLPAVLPDGIFSLDNLERFYERHFEKEGIPMTFGTLGAPLVIPATELDTSERAVFSTEKTPFLSIPKAICASSAIPVFYRPVRIGSKYYLDGGVNQVAHIDLALERGFRKIVVINPLISIHNDRSTVRIPSIKSIAGSIQERGMLSIFNQTFRSFTASKLHLALEIARLENPEVEILLIEPDKRDAVMFMHDSMDFNVRAQIAEFGYNQMKRLLEERAREIEAAQEDEDAPE